MLVPILDHVLFKMHLEQRELILLSRILKMRPLAFLVVIASLSTLVSSAALKPRDTDNKQYPWYYWNNDDGDQIPPYYYRQRCGAQGIDSLNVLSLLAVGLVALAFTGIPDASQRELKRIQY